MSAAAQIAERRPSRMLMFWHLVVLFLSLAMLGITAFKFHSNIHPMFGATWMLLSATAISVCIIDRIRGAKSTENRLVITVMILAVTIGVVASGLR